MAFSSRLLNTTRICTYGLVASKLLSNIEQATKMTSSNSELTEIKYNDYFNDEKLQLAVAGRKAAEFELRRYMKKASVDHRVIMESLKKASQNRDYENRALYLQQYNDFNHKLKLNAERMMYPGQNIGYRQSYLNHFGCTAWTEEALKKIREVSYYGVVELGAGSGKWAQQLRLRGVDVKAYDDMSFLPESKQVLTSSSTSEDKLSSETITLAKKAGVELGNETIFQNQNSNTYYGLKKSNNLNNRSLLLVYPPCGDMAVKVLREYKGNTLIYVGEGRGGVNANVDFFDILENRIKFKKRKDRTGDRNDDWYLDHVEELAPFPGGFEKLYIFKRK